jgi:hypothetical protein
MGHKAVEWHEGRTGQPRTAKRMKESERRCIMDVDIDECDCKELRNDFAALSLIIRDMMDVLTMISVFGIEEDIKTDPNIFFKYVDLEMKLVGPQSVISF